MNLGNERLLKLATHLESGKLGHEVFDFSEYNNTQKPECGTSGCALGECPIAFPDDWEFDSCGIPVTPESQGPMSSSMDFFNLTKEQHEHLFIPNKQCVSEYGGNYLDETATAAQVAANIRAFVEKREG